MKRGGEGLRGTGRFPGSAILGARADLRGAGGEACLKEGARGETWFPRATEPKAREAA